MPVYQVPSFPCCGEKDVMEEESCLPHGDQEKEGEGEPRKEGEEGSQEELRTVDPL